MFSITPFSSAPYSALSSDILYARAVLSSNSNLDAISTIRLFESVNFDCFAELSSSLYALREINVYYTVYVTTDRNYIMTLNTTDIETLYRASDFYSNFYVNTDLNYQLTVTRSLDLLLNAVKETQDGF